jgi:hypothetical protein
MFTEDWLRATDKDYRQPPPLFGAPGAGTRRPLRTWNRADRRHPAKYDSLSYPVNRTAALYTSPVRGMGAG